MESSVGRGRRGESVAAAWLESRGWSVLDRNWRDGSRELDLVVARDGVVAFVEVKTRSSGEWGTPLSAIDARKRRDVERAARRWIHERASGVGRISSFRFDAFAVRFRRGAEPACTHLPDAWRTGD